MATLNVHLLGKLEIQHDGRMLAGLDSRKAQELFCYLLLYRDRPHPRETLAELLWGNRTTIQSKGYLRKALWQLQTDLTPETELPGSHLLLVDADWVQLDPQADLWLDVAAFEQAYTPVCSLPGRELDLQSAETLRGVLDLYRGNLLEGWYPDWCLLERERFQHIYMALLDKLMDYCEAHEDYEAGLAHGTRILRYERARERTHRRLMRLHYSAGDRTAALRQYERCVTALHEELDVQPSKRTMELHQRIRADQLDEGAAAPEEMLTPHGAATSPLHEVIGRLRQLQVVLGDTHRKVQEDLEAIELTLNARQ